jgi:hypothetical protein
VSFGFGPGSRFGALGAPGASGALAWVAGAETAVVREALAEEAS